ncbi:MAG: methyltransferase [Chthoniobacterales bacterium]|nr:methyltransferase [Chthoniobacterales bacterium]
MPRRGMWRLPPFAWIQNSGCTGLLPHPPERILCATLPEAFLLAASLKEAEVVALNPSADLVKAGRTGASRRRLRNLRIEQAELDQPALGELIGGNFDVVLAHDVLHCVRDADAAFANLSAACAADGSVYVSVRTPGHPSARLDAAMEAFGMDARESGDEEAGKVRRLLAAMGNFLSAAPELAGDADGRADQTAPIVAWLDRASAAGLHLRASTLTAKALPRALVSGQTSLLAAFSTPSLVSLLDGFLQPASVEMVFTRTAHREPPWRNPDELREWRPVCRYLPLAKLQPLEPPWDGMAAVEVEIQGILEPQNFTLSRYLLEILRRSDGEKSLGELMQGIAHEADPATLVPGLHFLHNAFILELQEP